MVPLGAALAAAVRMVDWIHRHAAHLRAPAEPADAPRLAVGDVLVLEVADLSHRGAAGEAHLAQLARRELQQSVVALLRHQLDGGTRAAPELPAAPLAQLDVVDHRAERDHGEREAVARLDVGPGAGLDPVAHREAGGGEDVAL